jgi:hypothetical protein
MNQNLNLGHLNPRPPISPFSTLIVRDHVATTPLPTASPLPMMQALTPSTATKEPKLVAKSDAKSIMPVLMESEKPIFFQTQPIQRTRNPTSPPPMITRTPIPIIRPSKIAVGLTQIPDQELGKKIPSVAKSPEQDLPAPSFFG